MIKYDLTNINKWYNGSRNIVKCYHGTTIAFDLTGDAPTPMVKFSATYSDGTSYSAACDGNTTLTSGTTRAHTTPYSAMTDVEIGDCVTEIGFAAFRGCTGLQDVTIPNSVTSIGQWAFSGCTGLPSVTIPSGVTSIAKGTFDACNSLTSVTLSNSVTSIGQQAFRSCSGLTSIDIPNSVTSIGEETFAKCSGLTSVTIPSGVTSIARQVFDFCKSLTSVTIPSGVTSIGNSAFANCVLLPSVTIPSGVTSIGNSAFANCDSLTSVGPTGSGASVEIPSGVTSIADGAFNICDGLTSVTIPNSVITIGEDAFWGCEKLTSIDIPNNVTTIGESAFRICSRLQSVTIQSGVTSIGRWAFLGCTGLTSVTCLATTPPTLGTEAFDNTNDCPIYVPSGSVDTYKAASGWSNYSSRIQATPAPSRLPQGYTEVEYISSENVSESVLGPYINTNYKPTQNTRLVIDFQSTSSSRDYQRIFGSGEFDMVGYLVNIEGKISNSGYYYYKFGKGSNWYTTSVRSDLNRHVIDYNNSNQFLVDGTSIATLPNTTFTCSSNLGIFWSINTKYTTNNINFVGRIFSAKVYDNGTLIRDLVPCKRDSDSKYGMYDIVNDVFYTSVNSYSFSGGEPV